MNEPHDAGLEAPERASVIHQPGNIWVFHSRHTEHGLPLEWTIHVWLDGENPPKIGVPEARGKTGHIGAIRVIPLEEMQRGHLVFDLVSAWFQGVKIAAADEAAYALLSEVAETALHEGATGPDGRHYALADTTRELARVYRPGELTPEPLRWPDRFLSVDNSAVYQSFRQAVASGQGRFLTIPESYWPTATLDTRSRSVRAIAQLKPDPVDIEPFLTGPQLDDWKRRMARLVLALDDKTADVLDAISAYWLRQAVHRDEMVVLTADDFLKLRGLLPQKAGSGRRGGYQDADRREVAARIEALRHTRIRVFEMPVTEEGPGKRGPVRRRSTWAGESFAILVSSILGQVDLENRMDPYAWRVRPGDVFAPFLLGPGRQTALLSFKALEYDPYHQRWEKRLTRYFSWLWRCRAEGNSYADPVGVRVLLEAIGEGVSKHHPTNTKERLEKALDTLQQDGVVTAWQYGPDADETIVGQRGWVETWLSWKVIVEPPDSIQTHYRDIPEAPIRRVPALPTPANLGEKVKAARAARGLSQLQAAEQIGIANTLLSRVEAGKPIAPKTKRKLDAWLAG